MKLSFCAVALIAASNAAILVAHGAPVPLTRTNDVTSEDIPHLLSREVEGAIAHQQADVLVARGSAGEATGLLEDIIESASHATDSYTGPDAHQDLSLPIPFSSGSTSARVETSGHSYLPPNAGAGDGLSSSHSTFSAAQLLSPTSKSRGSKRKAQSTEVEHFNEGAESGTKLDGQEPHQVGQASDPFARVDVKRAIKLVMNREAKKARFNNLSQEGKTRERILNSERVLRNKLSNQLQAERAKGVSASPILHTEVSTVQMLEKALEDSYARSATLYKGNRAALRPRPRQAESTQLQPSASVQQPQPQSAPEDIASLQALIKKLRQGATD